MELYLSSYEYADFDIPKKVIQYRKTVIDNRNVMVAEIDAPLIGQKYGFGDADVSVVYLINRVDEDAFEKLNSFPIDVHVLIPKVKGDKEPLTLSQLQNIAWACLYDNETDARIHKPV